MTQQLEINLWYGDDQPFGQHGVSQRWVNVLGRVKGPAPIVKLDCTLNGGEPFRFLWDRTAGGWRRRATSTSTSTSASSNLGPTALRCERRMKKAIPPAPERPCATSRSPAPCPTPSAGMKSAHSRRGACGGRPVVHHRGRRQPGGDQL